MAHIILPSRWRRQPQYAVDINWSNPITRSLRIAVNWGDPRCFNALPINLATQLQFTRVGSTAVEYHAGPEGRAMSQSATQNNYWVPDGSISSVNTTTVAFRKNGVTADGSRGVIFANASGDWLGVNSSAKLSITTGSTERMAATPTVRDNQVIGINLASTAYKAYQDGVETGTASGAGGIFAVNKILGLTSGASVHRNRLYCLYLFTRILTPGEHKELSVYPYSMFKPLQRRLYSFPTALTISITATEATDVAALTSRDRASLAVTESGDVASLLIGMAVSLAATEGTDTATLTSSDVTTLSVTEGLDVASLAFEVAAANAVALNATETADTGSATSKDTTHLTVSEGVDIAAFISAGDILLSVTEGADIAALAFERQGTLVLAATEGPDTAAIVFAQQGFFALDATEDPDQVNFAFTPEVKPTEFISGGMAPSRRRKAKAELMELLASEDSDMAFFTMMPFGDTPAGKLQRRNNLLIILAGQA